MTLNPPNAVIFKDSKEEGNGIAYIEIKNKSDSSILYKVKTTEPNNYVVKPNQGILAPEVSI